MSSDTTHRVEYHRHPGGCQPHFARCSCQWQSAPYLDRADATADGAAHVAEAAADARRAAICRLAFTALATLPREA